MNATSSPIDADREILIGPREQLFHLLAEAAEIEHTLMCSYLYAGFSLKRGPQPNFSAEHVAAVEKWRKIILNVAREEMGHLLLVSNLAIALGGRPHFGRPNFPVAPGYFPSGVVVKLAPFSLETVDHFIFLERPRGVVLSDGDGFDPPSDYERIDVYRGLMPSLQDYSTIGRLYDALRENLIASAQRLGAQSLFIGPVAGQIGRNVMDMPGVATVDSLESALSAIDTIVEQGEGSSADRDDSHFQRFVQMKAQFVALLNDSPGFEPAWPVVTSPVMRRPPEPDDKVYIDAPDAAAILDLANAAYGLLLRFLVQSFGRNEPGATATQQRLLDGAIQLMHVMARLAELLATLPASPALPMCNAGMSFTMLRGVEPLFSGPAERQLLAERIAEIAYGAASLAHRIPGLAGIAEQMRSISVAPIGTFDGRGSQSV